MGLFGNAFASPDSEKVSAEVLEEEDALFERLADEVIGRKAGTPAGYKLVMSGLAKCRGMRTAIEKQRKSLKSDALKWGRTVDGEARRLTELINDIEEPLVATRKEEDDRKAAADAALAAEEERQRMDAEEAARKIREDIEAGRRPDYFLPREKGRKIHDLIIASRYDEARRLIGEALEKYWDSFEGQD